MVQALTEFDGSATIVSVDGVGAYDFVSRTALLSGLMDMEEGDKLLPCVRLFFSDPSTFLWDDEAGDTHEIRQGEGGEQGDALMPLLFSLGQHGALTAVARGLEEGERLFAFLDDLYVICRPDRVQAVHQSMVRELWDHAKISLHNGKTKVWNRGGIAPSGWSNLQQMAVDEDPDAVVWRGDTSLPTSRQGLLILGTPVGHDDFVREQLRDCRDRTRRSVAPHPRSPKFASSLAPPDFLRCRPSKFHLEDSPSSIGGRVRGFTQSGHLDMPGEDSWHRRFDNFRDSQEGSDTATLHRRLGYPECNEGAPRGAVGQLGRCSGDDSPTPSWGRHRDPHRP